MTDAPWALSAINAAGTALGRIGLAVSLDPEELVRAARRRTRLDDFGGDDWREPLERLTRAAETEARLTPFGRFYIRRELVQRLSNRLRIQDAVRRDPAILSEPVDRPVFILGLPRTGTTHLHRLLARDPRSRVLMTWEMAEPVPAPRPETYESDPRIARIARNLRLVHWAGPRLRAIHDIDAREPEECISLMANDLRSLYFAVGIHIPSYTRWLEEQDLTEPYRRHRRQLQLLQRHFRRDRWVLKAPVHMQGLSSLLAVYPDARVVWTHRDPADVIASTASLLYHFRSAFCRDLDPRQVGPEALEQMARWVEQGLQARAAHRSKGAGSARFVDVAYQDVVRSPVSTVERVYRALDLPFDEDTRCRMQRHLDRAVQHRHGVHRYRLEEYGLDRAQVARRFAGLEPAAAAAAPTAAR